MTAKRRMAILTALLLMVCLLAACGSSSPSPSVDPTAAPTDAPAATAAPAEEGEEAGGDEGEGTAEEPGLGKYDPPIEITSVKNLGSGNLDFPEGDSIDDNVWTRYYEEVLGIKVRWLWTVNEQQYEQKVNIAITSNDLPDIMSVKNTQLKMMYENEQLMDMTNILPDNWLPFTESVLTADGGDGLRSATFDGKLSAIPAVGSGLGNTMVLWVRTDWLEKLELEMPETTDDVLALCEAFTTQDPDGNGQNDTYGLAVHKDLFEGGYACLEGFFNSYGAYHDIWVPVDGGLGYGNVQPEAKTALAVLQDLYAKGQIDPEFGVKDANKVNEDVGAGRFGLMYGQFWNAAWINPIKVENPDFEWVPVSIPADGSTAAKAQMPFGTSNYYAVNVNAEHPEAFVKMLNLQLEKSYGATAESTRFNITPEGYGPYAYNVIYMEPAMKNFEAAKAVSDAVNSGDTSKLNDEQMNYYEMSMLSLNGDHANNNWHQLKMFGPNGSLTVMQGYWDSGNVMPNAFYGAPTQTMTEKLSTLKKQTLTDYTSIILGGSIDDFDTYVTNWNNLGGEQMTSEVNEWFATQ